MGALKIYTGLRDPIQSYTGCRGAEALDRPLCETDLEKAPLKMTPPFDRKPHYSILIAVPSLRLWCGVDLRFQGLEKAVSKHSSIPFSPSP